jgi:hypothetical protein
MRILAFHFTDGEAAEATMAQLSTEFEGEALDVRTAGVVVDGIEGIVLGVTVEADTRAPLIKLASSHGGRLVADVPEEWTDKPRN